MRRWFVAVALWLGAGAIVGACDEGAPVKAEPDPGARARPARAEVVMAPGGSDDVAAVIRAEAARAREQGRDLVVYVGAPWCEPCVRFHRAVEAGELDATFPTLRLLEFDHDRDEAGLARAGYASRMIPLFAVPADGGEASPLRMEGSVKGDGAVPQIVPRLQAMLAEARARRR